MELYLVTKQGVYDHGCFGVFAAQSEAESRAEWLMKNHEGDHHHYFRVDKIKLETHAEAVPVCTYVPQGKWVSTGPMRSEFKLTGVIREEGGRIP